MHVEALRPSGASARRGAFFTRIARAEAVEGWRRLLAWGVCDPAKNSLGSKGHGEPGLTLRIKRKKGKESQSMKTKRESKNLGL
jgi:hypothetical protein